MMNSRCCACSGRLEQVVDLGLQYITDFLPPGAPRRQEPLRLMLCTGCGLVQLSDFVPRDALYHERYGFKSGINEAVVEDLQSIAAWALHRSPLPHEPAAADRPPHPRGRRWLDIGSNDGTLLAAVPPGIWRAGVDPLGQFADEARTHADRIDVCYFYPELYDRGEFDIITSGAMFYDLEQPGEFARQVKQVLSDDGVWVIQQNYALHMLENNVIDNVIHEHLTYFTVDTLDRLLGYHGLEIFDVSYSGVKGGCIRTAVAPAGRRQVQPSVLNAIGREMLAQADQALTWQRWGLDVYRELRRTREELEKIAARGERCYVYGASSRGGTFLQIVGGGPDLLTCAVDRNPDKVGKIMSSTGLPIISEEQMRADPPEYLLIAPWFFRDVFINRETDFLDKGGAFIFALPHFEVFRR